MRRFAIPLCLVMFGCDAGPEGPGDGDPSCAGAKCDEADGDVRPTVVEPALVLRFDAMVEDWLCRLEGLCEGFDRKLVLIEPGRRQIEIFYSGFTGDEYDLTARVELQHEGDDFESEADFERSSEDAELYGFGVDIPLDASLPLDPMMFDVDGGLVEVDAFKAVATQTERAVADQAIDSFHREIRAIFADRDEWDAALAVPLYEWTATEGAVPLG